jgi:hypothetical protein
MFRGIMALEELAPEVTPVNPGEAAASVTEFIESAEAPIIEMNEAASEVTGITESMDQGADTAEVLDQMGEQVETVIAEDGGLTEHGAAAIEVAVEGLRTMVGFSRGKAFAMEGFGDKATRVQATKVALESIQDTVKKIWERIVAAFKAAIEYVQKFFAKVLDSGKRLEARADKFLAMAKAAEKDGKNPGDEKLDVTAQAKLLHVAGKFPEAKVLAEKLKASSTAEGKFYEEISKYADSLTSEASKEGGDAEKVAEPSLDANVLPEGYAVPEGHKVLSSELSLGGASLFLVLPTKETTKVQKFKAFFRSKAFLAQAKGAGKAPEKAEVAAFNAAEAGVVCEAVKASMAEVAKAKAGLDDMKKQLAEVEKQAKAAKEDKSASTKANAFRVSLNVSSMAFTQGRSFRIKTGKAALDVVAMSIKTYK